MRRPPPTTLRGLQPRTTGIDHARRQIFCVVVVALDREGRLSPVSPFVGPAPSDRHETPALCPLPAIDAEGSGTVNYTVFIYWTNPFGGPPRARYFYALERASAAIQLARFVRDTFGCPAWVAEYDSPADLHTIAGRATTRALDARKESA